MTNNEDGMENITNIDNVTKLLSKFLEIIKEENLLLESMRVQEIKDLQENKVKLAKWLSIFDRYIAMNPSWLESQDLSKQERLKEIYREFDQEITLNHEYLEKAILVNEQIVKWVYQETNKRNSSEIYSFNAQKAKPAAVNSITIDQRS